MCFFAGVAAREAANRIAGLGRSRDPRDRPRKPSFPIHVRRRRRAQAGDGAKRRLAHRKRGGVDGSCPDHQPATAGAAGIAATRRVRIDPLLPGDGPSGRPAGSRIAPSLAMPRLRGHPSSRFRRRAEPGARGGAGSARRRCGAELRGTRSLTSGRPQRLGGRGSGYGTRNGH